MAVLTLTNDIPNRTSIADMFGGAAWQSYGFFGDRGFVYFDIDQIAEPEVSDIVAEATGQGMFHSPNVGTIDELRLDSVDDGFTWATLTFPTGLSVADFVAVYINPAVSPADYENLFFSGDDQMFGGDARDILKGYDGNDIINGGKNRDTVKGGAGADYLAGDRSRDTVTGGDGDDTFVLNAPAKSAHADAITDFGNGNDIFLLAHADFSVFTGATVRGREFVVGTAALDANDRLIYDDVRGRVFFDADGSGAGAKQLIALVDPGTVLTASDFHIL